jgi:hypothetical protein
VAEDSAVALAVPAVVAAASEAVAPAEVGRPKDLSVSIRSTQKLRWLRQQCSKL